MQNAHILNLGPNPANEPEGQPPEVEDDFQRQLMEETRSDVRRMRAQLESQEDDHASHQRRTKILSIVLGTLIVLFAAMAWLAYPTVSGQKRALAGMLGFQNIASILGDRMSSVEANLGKVTTGLPALADRMDQLQVSMKSNLQAAQSQAQAAATRASQRIRDEVNQSMHAIQSRLAGVESNQKESSEHVAQLQAQISGLKREIDTMHEEAAASADRIKELNAAQQTSTSKLSGLSERLGTNQTALNTLTYRMERNRIEFQVPKNKSSQIAPDIQFTPKRIDVGRQEVDGILQFSDGKKVMIRGQGIRRPVTLYTPTENRAVELVLTEVSKNGISGYLMMPAPAKTASE